MAVGLVALLSIVAFVAVNALMTYVVVPSMDAGYRGKTRFGGVKIESVVTSALSSAAIPGVTGSASDGMTIVLGAFGEQLTTMAHAQGVDMELVHRVSASWDSLPHSEQSAELALPDWEEGTSPSAADQPSGRGNGHADWS